MSLTSTRTVLLAGIAAISLGGASHALAQKALDLPQPALPLAEPSEQLDNKRVEQRLQREEKALRELRQIVLQAKAQGNPVTVKDAGPDPDVQALQQRVNDLEETLRRQTGQMEETAHAAQLAAKAAADAADANKSLAVRLDAAEKQLQAGAAAPPPQAGGPPPAAVAAGPPAGAEAAGVLGTIRERGNGAGAPREVQADAGAPAGPGDEQTTYRAARQTLDSGDYVGAIAALQAYLERYPASPRASEANYWLGRTLALRSMHAEAAGAYARALKGWPQTAWAGDAVIRLSASLIELKRGSDACKALGEFDTRYGTKATAAVKARAKETRVQAACG